MLLLAGYTTTNKISVLLLRRSKGWILSRLIAFSGADRFVVWFTWGNLLF